MTKAIPHNFKMHLTINIVCKVGGTCLMDSLAKITLYNILGFLLFC